MPKKLTNKSPDVRFLKTYLSPECFSFVTNFILVWPSFALLPCTIYQLIPREVKIGDKPASMVIFENAIHEYNNNKFDESNFSGIDYLSNFIRCFINSLRGIGIIVVEEKDKSSLIVDYTVQEKRGKILNYRFEPLPDDHDDYIRRFYEIVVPLPIRLALKRSQLEPIDSSEQGDTGVLQAV